MNANLPKEIIDKFNTVVDGIFSKINRVLKRSYDPVNVRLTTKSKTLPINEGKLVNKGTTKTHSHNVDESQKHKKKTSHKRFVD